MASYQVYFDTLAGERRYRVDFDDDEPIENVLRDALVELSEDGHVMKGVSVGDLKVVWGGAQGKELDISRSLPEQGVKPNDVLRVLVDTYIGGARTVRTDRVEREWRLLRRLADANPGMIEIGRHSQPAPTEDVFALRLRLSPGVERLEGTRPVVRSIHTIRLAFTRFYPDVPIEAYVDEPLFHPNVKPENGFICLWQDANPSNTVIQAVARVQAMAAYRMLNLDAVHQMNRAAAGWYEGVARPAGLVPLDGEEVRVYQVHDGQFVWLEPGRVMAAKARRRLA